MIIKTIKTMKNQQQQEKGKKQTKKIMSKSTHKHEKKIIKRMPT